MDLFISYLLLISYIFWINGERLECTTALGLEGYLCNNGECMMKTWYCDGENDCQDGSDEMCDSAYVAPENLQLQYRACQTTLRQCDFRYPNAIISKPRNEKLDPTHVDEFCRYLEQFSRCTNGMNELCHQVEEIMMLYKDVKTRVCDDPFVRNYTRLAMTGVRIWRDMNFTILTVLPESLNKPSEMQMTKREVVCHSLTYLVTFMKINGGFWYWNLPYEMNIPDDRLLFDVPMQTFSRLMRPLDVKYGDLRLEKCNRGRELGYRNVYIDYREIFELMENKYGSKDMFV